MPDSASVVIHAAPARVQRWLARLLSPLITLTGAAIIWAAWGLAPWYVYALGVAVMVFGVWLQALVEMSGGQALIVGVDRSIQIHSPGLLAHDGRVDRQDIVSVTYAEAALNPPLGERLFSVLGSGGYLRIELREPRVLPGAWWTNYLWCLRAESDPSHIAPPLPHTKTAVVDFHSSKGSAAAALQLFAA
ncbi:hypothetical protein [Pedococcus bigeumensis]|uniref:hypothetical protein n=1 Tax=Pedococcus bigeumensis TaxID=433644 RepID=UPI00112DF7CB|nr:hypothetical protein [Pedococcus bigeumensis]